MQRIRPYRTAVYYFSGTGNSLAAARDIACKTGGELVPIELKRQRVKMYG